MDSFHLRIRIDRKIAEKAMQMAQARGMELPDVIRMMITKAVRIGDFSIDEAQEPPLRVAESSRPYYAYAARQWDPMKEVLDAELALALLNQFIASHSARIEALAPSDDAEQVALSKLRDEHEEARHLLATLDPSDTQMVQSILERFTLSPPATTPEGGAL
jgi:hypothetical protein